MHLETLETPFLETPFVPRNPRNTLCFDIDTPTQRDEETQKQRDRETEAEREREADTRTKRQTL